MVRTSTTAWRIVLSAALLSPAPGAAQDGSWALTNVRIETVTKGVIERGTIVIRDGLIVAVGADVTLPADARVLDLARRTVTPGLIDLTSSIGLSSGAAPTAGAAPRFVGLEPERSIVDEVKVSPPDARAAREAGITAALVAPTRGALRGLSALLPMRDSVAGIDALRAPVAEHFGFQGAGGGYPQTIMGVIAYQRQALLDARRHGLIEDRWRASPRGIKRPANDARLAALVPVVRGSLPVFYEANNENEIRRAVRVGKEFDLRMTVVGATEGWRALDALAGRSAIVSVNFPRPNTVTGWSYHNATRHAPGDSAAADREANKVIEGNAAALHKAGVRFALASGGTGGSAFVANVRKAIAAGLPADVALQAVTIRAAEFAGLGEALGSIEVGKIANLVVTEGGNVLADSALVKIVFVDGVRYDGITPPRAATNGGNGGTAPSGASVAGSWRLTIESPQGAQVATMVVMQHGATFAGKIRGMPSGDVDVTDGIVTGKNVAWSVALSIGGQSFLLGFTGAVEGSSMTGNVSMGPMGSAPFTGEKTP